jgi:hypothetical protein
MRTNQEIIDALAKNGCHVREELSRFLNDENFYVTCLKQVPADPSFEELGAALKAQDLKGAFEKAHALKGLLGNMALTPMYQTACAIVEPLRIGKTDDVEANYAKLLIELQELKDILAD